MSSTNNSATPSPLRSPLLEINGTPNHTSTPFAATKVKNLCAINDRENKGSTMLRNVQISQMEKKLLNTDKNITVFGGNRNTRLGKASDKVADKSVPGDADGTVFVDAEKTTSGHSRTTFVDANSTQEPSINPNESRPLCSIQEMSTFGAVSFEESVMPSPEVPEPRSLSERFAIYINRVNEMASENDRLKLESDLLRQRLADSCEERALDSKKFKAKLEALCSEKATVENLYGKAQRDVDCLKEDVQRRCEQIDELKQEVSTLNEALASSNVAIEAKNALVAEVKRELEIAEARFNAVCNELQGATSENTVLRNKVNELSADHEEIKKRVDKIITENEALKVRLAERNHLFGLLEEKLKASEEKLASTSEQMKTEKLKLRQQMTQQFKNKIKDFLPRSQLQALEMSNKKVQAQLEELNVELEKAKKMSAEKEEVWKSCLKDKDSKIKELLGHLSKKDAKICALRSQRDDMRKEVDTYVLLMEQMDTVCEPRAKRRKTVTQSVSDASSDIASTPQKEPEDPPVSRPVTSQSLPLSREDSSSSPLPAASSSINCKVM